MLHDQKSQDKKLNILRIERAFQVKLKAFFIIFKGLSAAKNYLGPESAPLKQWSTGEKKRGDGNKNLNISRTKRVF